MCAIFVTALLAVVGRQRAGDDPAVPGRAKLFGKAVAIGRVVPLEYGVGSSVNILGDEELLDLIGRVGQG